MKVVVAVDGSKYGRWATQWVARMPFATPLHVTALHVVDVVSLKAPLTPHSVVVWNVRYLRAELRRMDAWARKVTAETKTLMASLGLQGRVFSEKGAVAPTILKHAARRGGLVVLGHRGLDALDRFMLGSVSAKVTLHAPCSVLVVKQPPRPIRRILLATDGSKSSDRAIQSLLKSIRPDHGPVPTEVLVTHVMPFLRYPEIKETAEALLHGAAEKLVKAGYRAKEVSAMGHPADEILKVAQRQNPDLLVTGAKGLGAVARFFLGSVSTALVQHSPCSVLVVR